MVEQIRFWAERILEDNTDEQAMNDLHRMTSSLKTFCVIDVSDEIRSKLNS